MRTVFVNPSSYRNPPKRRKTRRKPARRAPVRHTAPVRRRRRRNAGIVPFTSSLNTAAMANPRRRRRNPRRLLGGRIIDTLMNVGVSFLGTAVGASANIFAIRHIQNVWARNGVRILGAAVVPFVLRGSFGASLTSGLLYPAFSELAYAMKLVPEANVSVADLENATEADLRAYALEADLDMSLNQAGFRRHVYA